MASPSARWLICACVALCGLFFSGSAGGTTLCSHYISVYPAYWGGSECSPSPCAGYMVGAPMESAYAGVLRIVPGDRWANYVGAARAGVPYTIKSVKLVHESGVVYRPTVLSHPRIVQEGSANISLHWPLLYDLPDSTWTLTVIYSTPSAWDDDGMEPNPPSVLHADVWCWTLEADIDHMQAMVRLFHSLPRGTGLAPLLSDEHLYADIRDVLAWLKQVMAQGDYCTASTLISQLFDEIDGAGSGLASTQANPVRERLLAEIDGLQQFGLIYP